MHTDLNIFVNKYHEYAFIKKSIQTLLKLLTIYGINGNAIKLNPFTCYQSKSIYITLYMVASY